MVENKIHDGVWIIRLNEPPLNTITHELLAQIRQSVQQASADRAVKGIVIAGDDKNFSAGADIRLFQQVATTDDAFRLCQVFQTAFQEIEDCAKPVVAALSGRVIGGALELAMACHFRVAGTSSRLTMPEVKLGINPGAGGTQRLPRLVGVAAALKMLLTAETVDAQRALEMNLVDEVCRDEQVANRAQHWALTAASPKKTRERTNKIQNAEERETAYRQAEQQLSAARPEIIAPWRIVDAVRTGLEESFEAGLVREQHAFDECRQLLGTQNKIYLFFATSQTSKIAELADQKTRPLTHAAVVGMGSMGTGIAQALIRAGVPTVVLDEDPSALERGADKISNSLQKRVSQGKLAHERAEQTLDLLSTTTRWDDIAHVDLVIESVFEDVDVKRAVLRQLESVCPPDTILATNTSTLPLDDLALEMLHPLRLIGMHFFNPAHYMPLLEIVHREVTPPEIQATVIRWAKALRKTPVLVASRVGFMVTRLFVPYVQEAFELVEEGATPAAVDQAAVDFGFPMGPLLLMDVTGLDILAHSQRVLASALPRHGDLSPIARRLVERGHLGQKTGIGIYRYEPGSRAPLESAVTAEIIADVRQERGQAPRGIKPEEIEERLVLRMVNEAFYVLEESVARCQADVDVATVLGTGFPDFRGGVLKYANDLGLERVVARLDQWAGRLGERFTPSQLLKEMKNA